MRERKKRTRNKNDSNANERTREKVKRVWSCNRSSMKISRVPSSDL